jgi:hypothetical protein
MADSYTAQVDKDVAAIKELMLAVRNKAIEYQVDDMQTPVGAGGHLRVDTNFLRASLRAAIGDANFVLTFKPDDPKARYTYNPDEVVLVIAKAELSDPIEVVYTANYAEAREFGSRGQAGDRWVGLSAQRWKQNVDRAANELKARRGS